MSITGTGWAGRIASPRRHSTQRQRGYAAAWKGGSIYTPGFAVNGREWRGWFSGGQLPQPSGRDAGKLTLTLRDATHADIVFAPAGTIAGPLRAEIALLAGDLAVDVKRGENNGRKLRHDFVALHHATAAMRVEGGRLTATIELPAKLAEKPIAIAAWVAPGEAQPPLQATGGWLRPE
jgi:hypothetical protein